MLCDKDLAMILRREHVAGVELDAQWCNMRPQFLGGGSVVLATLATTKLRIQDFAPVTIGVANISLWSAGNMLFFRTDGSIDQEWSKKSF